MDGYGFGFPLLGFVSPVGALIHRNSINSVISLAGVFESPLGWSFGCLYLLRSPLWWSYRICFGWLSLPMKLFYVFGSFSSNTCWIVFTFVPWCPLKSFIMAGNPFVWKNLKLQIKDFVLDLYKSMYFHRKLEDRHISRWLETFTVAVQVGDKLSDATILIFTIHVPQPILLRGLMLSLFSSFFNRFPWCGLCWALVLNFRLLWVWLCVKKACNNCLYHMWILIRQVVLWKKKKKLVFLF